MYAVLVGSAKVSQDSKTVLLKQLAGYKGVASSNAADMLLEHYRGNYTIELEEGATILYRLLYNLSLKELEVLREYLLTV